MTYRVPLSVASQYGDQFGVAVAAHAAAMRDWRAHMERVEQDKDRDIPDTDKHAPYPQPRAAPEIEGALGNDGEPDFEVYDDGPSDSQKMADMKAEKFTEVGFYTEQMIESILPMGRRNMFEIRRRDVAERDAALLAKRGEELQNSGLIDKITGKQSALLKQMMEPDFIRTLRSAEDNAIVDEQSRILREIESVQRWSAEQHEAIEDIQSIEDLAAWSPAPLV